MTEIIMTKDSVTRLLKDVKDIMKNPLHQNGIYYKHHESNMLKGYAMIVGPVDTPYCGGFYFFEFDFPPDYPYSPPKLTFCTNGYNIRLHPNFYKSGKVCVSLLNTWRGEQWTSCQSISTILLTIVTLFTNNPLLHEPGVGLTHPDMQNYNDIIEFANIRVAICDILMKASYIHKNFFDFFESEYKAEFQKHKNKLYSFLNKNNKLKSRTIETGLYTIQTEINYTELYNIMEPLFELEQTIQT